MSAFNYNLAACRVCAYNYAAAERSFEKAVRPGFKGKPKFWPRLGGMSRDFRNSELAEKYLRRALQEKDALA